MKVRIESGSGVVMDNVEKASGFWDRLMGLMGRNIGPEYEGMILINCGSIHTFFMRSVIDAVYLSKDYTVIGYETIKPWRIGKLIRGTKHVIELPEGSNKFAIGEKIEIYDYSGER